VFEVFVFKVINRFRFVAESCVNQGGQIFPNEFLPGLRLELPDDVNRFVREISAVRFIPCCVMSKIHERIAERTKVQREKHDDVLLIIAGGASKVGRKIEAAWISSQEATAYATATL
jgi:hypothetical protein